MRLFLAALLLAPLTARAADPAEAERCDICLKLDAAEESCEKKLGDHTELCEAIGKVEESCPQKDEDDDDAGEAPDPDDGHEAPADAPCPELGTRLPALVEACTAKLGADHRLCRDLAGLRDRATHPAPGN